MTTENTSDSMPPQPSELDMLKARASIMGITHSNNISVETLRTKIAERQASSSQQSEQTPAEKPAEQPVRIFQENPLDLDKKAPAAAPAKAEEPIRVMNLREYMIREHTKLVRCRITNLDPKKKDLPGEIITVANEHLGTIRKMVPYGEYTENGYHIPHCIYKFLKDRKFVSITTTRDRRTGHITVSKRDVPEFSIEVLPPLTSEELDDLRQAQLAAGTID